jgi:hypothetical protein
VGDGVAVGEAVIVGITPGGRVGWGVPVGRSGAGLFVQAASTIANTLAINRLLNITIFIIEKRSGVNACESMLGMINFTGITPWNGRFSCRRSKNRQAKKEIEGIVRVAKHTRRMLSPPNTPISSTLLRQFQVNLP